MTYAQFVDSSTDPQSAFGFQFVLPFPPNRLKRNRAGTGHFCHRWWDNFFPLPNFFWRTVLFSVWSGRTILLRIVLVYERSIPPEFLSSLVPGFYFCPSLLNHFERTRKEVSRKLVKIFRFQYHSVADPYGVWRCTSTCIGIGFFLFYFPIFISDFLF